MGRWGNLVCKNDLKNIEHVALTKVGYDLHRLQKLDITYIDYKSWDRHFCWIWGETLGEFFETQDNFVLAHTPHSFLVVFTGKAKSRNTNSAQCAEHAILKELSLALRSS